MKPTKKKTVACPAALRLEAMLPVDAGILSQQADDWTDRSVERGTVGPLGRRARSLAQLPLPQRDLHRLPAAQRTIERHPFRRVRSLEPRAGRCGAQPRGVRRLQTAGRRPARRHAQPRTAGTLQRPLPQPVGQPPAAGTLHGVRPDGSGAERLPPRRRRLRGLHAAQHRVFAYAAARHRPQAVAARRPCG